MKKVMMGLCALMMCFLMTACGEKSGISKMEALVEDVQKNGSSWDAAQWENFFKGMYAAQLEAMKAVETAEDFKAIEDANEKATTVLDSIQDQVNQQAIQDAFQKLMADEEFMKLLEETENLVMQLEQKFNMVPESDLEETLAADSLDIKDSIDGPTLEPAE